MLAGHAVDPSEEPQCRPGEHPQYPVLESAGPFPELGPLREIAVDDRVVRVIDHGFGCPIHSLRTG